jgi:hypothetical protein
MHVSFAECYRCGSTGVLIPKSCMRVASLGLLGFILEGVNLIRRRIAKQFQDEALVLDSATGAASSFCESRRANDSSSFVGQIAE